MAKKDFSLNPPINTALADGKGNATPVWAQWFGNVFQTPTRDKPWTPAITGLSGTGSFTVTGLWNRTGPMVFFRVMVTPNSGNTTSASAAIGNFPFNTVFGQAQAFNVSTRQSIGAALVDGVVSIPNWSSISAPVEIVGFAQVGGD